MWHEAKKQERKIHGIIVDYRKRAERRREFYEKIKQDPTQFLRIHARTCKVNLDPAVALAAEGPGTMMPWQGDKTHMIDRFDARAHLDVIPDQSVISAILPAPHDPDEEKCYYERYRTLVQNECAGISEEQCLQQIQIDEMFPDVSTQKAMNEEKEKLKGKRAAIGFTYEVDNKDEKGQEEKNQEAGEDSDEDEDSESSDTSLSDIDIDINVDVDELNDEQKAELNIVGTRYGMKQKEYIRMLERDKHELDMQKRYKEIEEEKALYSGRKSRRERRMLVEKRLLARGDNKMSPPSYASRDSPTYQDYRRSGSHSSRSRSTSPEDTGKVTFITSFGQDKEEEETKSEQPSKSKMKKTSSKSVSGSDSHSRTRRRHRHSSSSTSSSKSHSRSPLHGKHRYHSNSRSRSRSSSRGRHKRRRSSSSRSWSSRSRSRSPVRGHRRSRSRSPERHGAWRQSHDRYRRSRSSSRSRSHGWTHRPRSRSRSRSRDRFRGRSRSVSREKGTLPQTPSSLKNNRSTESSVGKTPGSVDKVKKNDSKRKAET